jgi:hypothetical protein
MKENDAKKARCRGGWFVLTGEVTPLLELDWRLEEAFTSTTSKKVNLEFVLALYLAVWLMV